MTPLDLLAGLPDPTPDALRAARSAAGHSQADAAKATGLAHSVRWSEYERGVGAIDPARWALYLLATGQHPGARLARTGPRKSPVRPAAAP